MEDSAAWDEVVYGNEVVKCWCGATFGSNEAWDAHSTPYVLESAEGQAAHGGYSVTREKTTVHHEAAGHYETVHHEATGNYETKTTGYRCSCGARKWARRGQQPRREQLEAPGRDNLRHPGRARPLLGTRREGHEDYGNLESAPSVVYGETLRPINHLPRSYQMT